MEPGFNPGSALLWGGLAALLWSRGVRECDCACRWPLMSLCDRWGVSHAECDTVSGKSCPWMPWALRLPG